MLALTTIPGVIAAAAFMGFTLYAALQLKSPISFVAWAIHASLFAYQVTYGGFLIEFWLAGVVSAVTVAASAVLASRM